MLILEYLRARVVTTGVAFLNGWTWNRSIGTKYTAITFLGTEQGTTAGAFIKPLAGIGWHQFLPLVSTLGAGDRRFKNQVSHDRPSKANHSIGDPEFANAKWARKPSCSAISPSIGLDLRGVRAHGTRNPPAGAGSYGEGRTQSKRQAATGKEGRRACDR